MQNFLGFVFVDAMVGQEASEEPRNHSAEPCRGAGVDRKAGGRYTPALSTRDKDSYRVLTPRLLGASSIPPTINRAPKKSNKSESVIFSKTASLVRCNIILG
jgi:hypothetical protein